MKLDSIISGLNRIHQQKVIHCDLLHGNILISNSRFMLSISEDDVSSAK